MQKFLDYNLGGNTGQDWLIAVGVLLAGLLIFKIITSTLIVRLQKLSEKTDNKVDDFLIGLIRSVKPPFYFFVSLYIATQFLNFKDIVEKIIFAVVAIVVVIQVVVVLQKVIDFMIKNVFLRDDDDSSKDKEAIVNLMGQIVKALLWVIGILMILDNLGVDVTSLVAGLGIGGIAIALALQGILGDLFASFSIFVDKPFKVGDFVSSGTDKGTVTKIGVKTTRLKTAAGDELIISNKDLTEARLNNFKRMKKRTANFTFGVTYETPLEKLKQIPKMTEEIVNSVEDVECKRVNFTQLGDFSLNFKAVFQVNSPGFKEHAEAQEKINYGLMEKFEQEGIEFAYPTQTIINKNG